GDQDPVHAALLLQPVLECVQRHKGVARRRRSWCQAEATEAAGPCHCPYRYLPIVHDLTCITPPQQTLARHSAGPLHVQDDALAWADTKVPGESLVEDHLIAVRAPEPSIDRDGAGGPEVLPHA